MFCFHLVETILEKTSYRVNMKMKLLKNIHFVSYTDDDLVKKIEKPAQKTWVLKIIFILNSEFINY